MSTAAAVNRRGFLKTSAAAAGGLVVGFYLPENSKLAAESTDPKLNAFVRVGTDDSVTLTIHRAELGQGSMTALSMLLAEELECDWSKIRTEFAKVDPANYGVFGSPVLQGVFGSLSIRGSWDQLRTAGATAREMLIAAAAQKWAVDKSQCRAEKNSVINTGNNARLSYGSLAEAASQMPRPVGKIALKSYQSFNVIGKSPKRLDTRLKVTGKADYGIDVRVPGMQYAVLERCPVFGGKVASFDASKTKTVPGVKQVVQISNGVAVIADNTWSAMEGRRALKVQWNEGALANTSSATIRSTFSDLLTKPGAVALNTGNTEAALPGAAKKIDALYEAPYLSHAPMEPHSCVVAVRPDSCEIWAGTQIPSAARDSAEMITGLPKEKIDVHTYFLGGSFGRPGQHVDEAIEIAKAAGIPIKLTWSREDDMQHDIYRPASLTKFSAGLDADGWPVAWTARVASPSFSGLDKAGVDRNGVDGISSVLYGIPNIHVEYHPPEVGIPVGYWRSVGPSQNTFFTESFVDEMAAAGGKDPVEFRRRLLAKSPRMLGVLNLAAEKAGWGKPLPAGHFHGVAVVNSLGGFNAQIAEVSVDGKGKYRVHRVVCAEDCGQVVNPAGVVQQIQGGIVFGLSALKDGITIDKGRVQQTNFNTYEVLRIDEMPVIEVYLMPSHETPGGIGEASTPPIGPAVANAIFAATGKRIRTLPIRAEQLI
ncbi:MAG TPA: xanthine dehydrogenase family protein molybdopterin-binding subunit [Bryobacteraceae bacterium]|jgi:isoquinoline 1-oxidoreductase beta subunit|nr:xanthine dehydrogenase family protein molybdopterin-binding subunit [Bryobacteraceae bacterium]